MNFKVFLSGISLFVLVNTSYGQKYILPNEELIYSFETQSGKTVLLAKDKGNEYIVYRFGTKDKIEFEYPEKTKDSWFKFKYSFYFRGGGKDNEGMDLNYVYFTNNDFQYVVYDTYFSVGEKLNVGIKIIDLKANKTINIKAKTHTQKGTLVDFRYNYLLEIGEDFFD